MDRERIWWIVDWWLKRSIDQPLVNWGWPLVAGQQIHSISPCSSFLVLLCVNFSENVGLLLFIILLFSSCSYFISLFDIIASYFSTSPFSICRISFFAFYYFLLCLLSYCYYFFKFLAISDSLLLLFVPISPFLLLLSLSFPFSSSYYFSVFTLISF